MLNLTKTYKMFAIIEQNGRRFIELEEVTRLHADGNCTWVYLRSGEKVLTTKNLGYYEKILPQPHEEFHNSFFRIHYGHLVNLSHILKYNHRSKCVLLKSGETISIAQRRAKAFKLMLSQFALF